MPATDITKEFQETLDEYQDWVNKNIGLNKGWDDEVFYIISVRDDLHNLVGKLLAFPADFDKERLRMNDKKWQVWIQNHTYDNFEFEFSRQDKPKSEWWWWIDKISELDEKDRTTL